MGEKRPLGLDFYREHVQSLDPKDFWGQVRRTINGKPVDQAQIDMIVGAMTSLLDLRTDDTLLDLCCGNGALTTYLFERCSGGLGVDFSEYLIQVANENFIRRPSEGYVHGDVLAYAAEEKRPERFTKAMCYGSFQFIPEASAAALLQTLRERFRGLRSLVLGNMPDRDRMHDFFRPEHYTPGIEHRADSPVGIWRTREAIAGMAESAGWRAEFYRMPAEYHASHYRFDALLTPR